MHMQFAVVMRKQNIENPWATFKWVPVEVLPDLGQFPLGSEEPTVKQSSKIVGRFLERDNSGESWLFTGFELKLFPDEAEGYYLNISSPEPCWFVMWRLEEDPGHYLESRSLLLPRPDEHLAIPHRICLSYNEAARLIDGGEFVDSIKLGAEHKAWLQGFVDSHYHPEPKRRQRPASFKGATRPAEN